MSSAAMPALRAALLGSPNCGKTTLFNLLTGVRQKVANYAGVTVERKEGWLQTASGRQIRLLDLPGTYSLHAYSEDERIASEVVTGKHPRKHRRSCSSVSAMPPDCGSTCAWCWRHVHWAFPCWSCSI